MLNGGSEEREGVKLFPEIIAWLRPRILDIIRIALYEGPDCRRDVGGVRGCDEEFSVGSEGCDSKCRTV